MEYHLCHKCQGVAFGEIHDNLYWCGCINTGHGDVLPLNEAIDRQKQATLDTLRLFRSQGRSKNEIIRSLWYRANLFGISLAD